jgi:hypothetical protein
MKKPLTTNIYGASGEGYRLMAVNVERFPRDTHRIQPFLPQSDETFEISPEMIPAFCSWLRDLADRMDKGDV